MECLHIEYDWGDDCFDEIFVGGEVDSSGYVYFSIVEDGNQGDDAASYDHLNKDNAIAIMKHWASLKDWNIQPSDVFELDKPKPCCEGAEIVCSYCLCPVITR